MEDELFIQSCKDLNIELDVIGELTYYLDFKNADLSVEDFMTNWPERAASPTMPTLVYNAAKGPDIQKFETPNLKSITIVYDNGHSTTSYGRK